MSDSAFSSATPAEAPTSFGQLAVAVEELRVLRDSADLRSDRPLTEDIATLARALCDLLGPTFTSGPLHHDIQAMMAAGGAGRASLGAGAGGLDVMAVTWSEGPRAWLKLRPGAGHALTLTVRVAGQWRRFALHDPRPAPRAGLHIGPLTCQGVKLSVLDEDSAVVLAPLLARASAMIVDHERTRLDRIEQARGQVLDASTELVQVGRRMWSELISPPAAPLR